MYLFVFSCEMTGREYSYFSRIFTASGNNTILNDSSVFILVFLYHQFALDFKNIILCKGRSILISLIRYNSKR